MVDPTRTGRRKPRWSTLLLVVLFHVIVIAGLARAFAPDFTTSVVEGARSLVTVTVSTPDPPATPPPDAEPEPEEEGAAAPEGPKAKPKPTAAPEKTLPVKPSPVPRAASTGDQDQSGARDEGEGTGGGGEGDGTGSGLSGSGQGSGIRKLEKIAGEINSARDYPRASRDLRIGHSVTIMLTVGTDGRVQDCRVTDHSPDPEADRLTCQLATERFRFRPAADSRGNPITGRYAWRQRWYY